MALEAIRGLKTTNEIASEFGVHTIQIGYWKKQALESLPEIFTNNQGRSRDEDAALRDRLYQQIGQLQVELEWLKKRLDIPAEVRRGMVDQTCGEIPIKRQCELLGLSRSSWYYRPKGENRLNLTLMRLIDEQYTRTPFYGSPKMTA